MLGEPGEPPPEGECVLVLGGVRQEHLEDALELGHQADLLVGGERGDLLDGEGGGGEAQAAVGEEHPAEPVGVPLLLGEPSAADREGVEVGALDRFAVLDALVDRGGGPPHQALGVGGALERKGSLDHLDKELERPALTIRAGAAEGLLLGGVGGAAVGAAPKLLGVRGLAASAVAEEAGALGEHVGGGGHPAEDQLLGADTDAIAVGETDVVLDGSVIDPEPVAAPEVLEECVLPLEHDLGVLAGDERIFDGDVAIRATAEDRLAWMDVELLQ